MSAADRKLVRVGGIAIAVGFLVACNDDGQNLSPTAPVADQTEGTSAQSSGAQTQVEPLVVTVECEKDVPPRQLRSKISVNGNNLQPGRYRARVTSPPGSNPIIAAGKQSVGDEVEFDFDSQVDPGETPIPANYIRIVPGGPDVRGEIILTDGRVLVGSQSVDCAIDN